MTAGPSAEDMDSPTSEPIPQHESCWITWYNDSRWQHPRMQKYVQEMDQPNGELHLAMGPPVRTESLTIVQEGIDILCNS